MAGNSSQADGTNDAGLELWHRFFGDMDEASKEMEVLRIKAVILNHHHEQPINLYKSLGRLQLMQLAGDIPKSTEIEGAVHALTKNKSFIIRKLASDINKGWNVRTDRIANKMSSGRQAPASSSTSTPQPLNIGFHNEVIETTVTSSAQEVECFIQEVRRNHRHHLVVGLDTEWRVVQEDGELRHRTALLQLCVDKRCLVFQIHHADAIPDMLKDFLKSPLCIFVGAAVDCDIRRLSEDYGIKVQKWSDLQTLDQKSKGYRRKLSLKDLAQSMMDVTVDKNIVHTYWGEPELTPSLIKYAAIDAYVSSKLGMLMNINPVTN